MLPAMTAVEWVDGKVRFIDQTRLPGEEVFVETVDYRRVAEAIKRLEIRGAPAIGVAVSFALLLAINDPAVTSLSSLERQFNQAAELLSGTRLAEGETVLTARTTEECLLNESDRSPTR